MAFVRDNTVVWAPKITTPIDGTVLQLSGELTPEQAARVAGMLRDGSYSGTPNPRRRTTLRRWPPITAGPEPLASNSTRRRHLETRAQLRDPMLIRPPAPTTYLPSG